MAAPAAADRTAIARPPKFRLAVTAMAAELLLNGAGAEPEPLVPPLAGAEVEAAVVGVTTLVDTPLELERETLEVLDPEAVDEPEVTDAEEAPIEKLEVDA